MNLAISSIKFFYKNIMKKDIFTGQRRPRHDKRLPVVLSQEEILKMLEAEKNIKHRLLLMIVYASGLRVGEVVRLKRKDIDTDRKTIIINSGKGRKDRYSVISDTVNEALAKYYYLYDINDWLFPGTDIRYIQELLGHSSIRTTERYTHVARYKISKIISPMDFIHKKD